MPEHVLNDRFEETLQPLLHYKPLFLLRDGILNPFERARRNGIQTALVATARPQGDFPSFSELYGLGPFTFSDGPIAEPAKPAALLANIGDRIAEDLRLLEQEYIHPTALQIQGDARHLYAHPTAQLSQYAVFDTTTGPVVIGAGVKIGAMCLVKGPVYLGPGTQLDTCRINNSIAGTECRLGGEIADSIIGDYSNKHHDGFLGHSLVGDWVNLGALTTTSDLKNNYGEVRLKTPGAVYPTGTIKFGAVIGDYVKTAIGTMLGTGSIIGMGANLFGETHWAGYIAPLSWGKTGVYDRALFLRDAARMMQRRGKSVTPALEALLQKI